jgi:predicted nucleotidyltransferase
LTLLTPLQEYLQQEYQDRLDRMILFGSQARGDSTPTSDVDVLIVLQDPVDASTELDRTSQFIAQLCLKHNMLISRLFSRDRALKLRTRLSCEISGRRELCYDSRTTSPARQSQTQPGSSPKPCPKGVL